MSETRRRFLAVVGTTLAVAGCLDDGGGDDPTPTPTPTRTPTSTPTDGGGSSEAAVAVRDHDDLGTILVDGEGTTLYVFDSDTQGADESTCGSGCVGSWPPLTDEEATAGENVTAELSTFEREDGDTQVAANGWPLYYFSSDSEPGQARGQGVNDVWWVLDPAGEPVRGSDTEANVAGDTY